MTAVVFKECAHIEKETISLCGATTLLSLLVSDTWAKDEQFINFRSYLEDAASSFNLVLMSMSSHSLYYCSTRPCVTCSRSLASRLTAYV